MKNSKLVLGWGKDGSKYRLCFRRRNKDEDQTVNDLNTLAGVDATRLAGAYDIIAKVNAESTEILSRIIGLDIKKLDRIQSTLTLIVNEDL